MYVVSKLFLSSPHVALVPHVQAYPLVIHVKTRKEFLQDLMLVCSVVCFGRYELSFDRASHNLSLISLAVITHVRIELTIYIYIMIC
jgi:hypothetical protein